MKDGGGHKPTITQSCMMPSSMQKLPKPLCYYGYNEIYTKHNRHVNILVY